MNNEFVIKEIENLFYLTVFDSESQKEYSSGPYNSIGEAQMASGEYGDADTFINNKKMDELAHLREDLQSEYESFNFNYEELKTRYNEEDSCWELIFQDDVLLVTDSKQKIDEQLLLSQIVYQGALKEGIIIGINNPEVGSDILKKLHSDY